jgi:hypothetical protein
MATPGGIWCSCDAINPSPASFASFSFHQLR